MKRRVASIVLLLVLAAATATVVVVQQRARRGAPPRQPAPPPPPPLVAVHAPERATFFLLPSDITPGDSVRTILRRDLAGGGWLRPVPLDSVAGAVALVRVAVAQGPGAGIRVELFDGRTLRLYRTQTFPLIDTTSEGRRWSLHAVADAVQGWITGYSGVAASRLAYISHGTLHVVDADGARDQAFPFPGDALSPAWSHDGRHIVYSDLAAAGTRLAELDLARGTTRVLSGVPVGLNITPVYAPDDRWIVFAHGDDDGTTLVAVRRDSVPAPLRVILPRGAFDNESPAFSPDGRRIAFVSARPRTPQIYSVNADGSDERLETPLPLRGRSYRTSPDWSPDGRTIAFEQQNGDFQIWLLALADHHMRRVTSVGENEDPCWAPDSRHLAFTSLRGGKKNIWVLDVPSGDLRQITHTNDARLAAWSPVLALPLGAPAAKN